MGLKNVCINIHNAHPHYNHYYNRISSRLNPPALLFQITPPFSFLSIPLLFSPLSPPTAKRRVRQVGQGQFTESCLSAVFFICINLTLLHPSLGMYSAPMYGSLPLAQTHPWSNSSNNITSDPLPFLGPLTPEQHRQGLRRPPVRSEHTACVCVYVCVLLYCGFRLLFKIEFMNAFTWITFRFQICMRWSHIHAQYSHNKSLYKVHWNKLKIPFTKK